MATQVQTRRGTTAEHSTFTGAAGELTVDTDKEVVVVHDGSTAGGHPMLRQDQANLPSSAPSNGVYVPSANNLAISTNGTGRLFIASDGKVGIGTASPAVPLHIYGTNGLYVQDSTNNKLLDVRSKNDVAELNAYDGDDNSAVPIVFKQYTSERLRITSDGKLGLGTSDPGSGSSGTFNGLHIEPSAVNGELTTLYLRNRDSTLDTAAKVSIEMKVSNSNRRGPKIVAFKEGTYADASQADSGLAFVTVDNDVYVDALTLKKDGKVGIGTTGPQHLCQIAGTLAVDSYNDTTKTITLRPGFEANANGGMGLAAKDHSGANPDGLGIYGTDGVSVHTANAGTFFERFRVDTSGRLLVGTSTARSTFYANITSQTQVEYSGATFKSGASYVYNVNSTGGAEIVLAKTRSASVGGTTIVNSGDTIGAINFQGSDGSVFAQAAAVSAFVDGTPGANDMPGRLVFSTTADGASSPTERMRITSGGGVLITAVNTTSDHTDSGFAGPYLYGGSLAGIIYIGNGSTGNRTAMDFRKSGAAAGSIVITSAGATQYNTTSDYRLKENVVPLTGAADRLNRLNVKRFNFISAPAITVDGFLAHEVQEVVPECVSGTKDGVEVWLEGDDLPEGVSVGDPKHDADGNQIPAYQGIDQSKLVPLLTAALQEALAEIESLKARVTALEP